jgi:hypothetical protein
MPTRDAPSTSACSRSLTKSASSGATPSSLNASRAWVDAPSAQYDDQTSWVAWRKSRTSSWARSTLALKGPRHNGGDVDLVVAAEREELRFVLGEEPPEGLRIRQALALQSRQPRCVPFQRDPLVPLVVHERPAPIEENRAQYGRLG